MDKGWMIFTAILVAVPLSLLGVILMHRKMILLGDAIAHSVLPGLVVSFIIFQSRDSFWMLLGAIVIGFLSTLFVRYLSQKQRLKADAALGVSYTSLFSIGLILLAIFGGRNLDIDQECVLYGNIETSVLSLRFWEGKVIGTKAVFSLIGIAITVITFCIVAFRPIQLWIFDPLFAKIRFGKMNKWEIIVLLLLSIQAVLSFESVGAILVIGFLAIPSSAAFLVSKNIKQQMLLSAFIGVLASILGVFFAYALNVSVAPLILLVSALFFVICFVISRLNSKTKVY